MHWATVARVCAAIRADVVLEPGEPNSMYGRITSSLGIIAPDRVHLVLLWGDDGHIVPAAVYKKHLVLVPGGFADELYAALPDDAKASARLWYELAKAGSVPALVERLQLEVSLDTMMRIAREHADASECPELVADLERIARAATRDKGVLTFGETDNHWLVPVLLHDSGGTEVAYTIRRDDVSYVAEFAALSDAPRGIALWKSLALAITQK